MRGWSICSTEVEGVLMNDGLTWGFPPDRHWKTMVQMFRSCVFVGMCTGALQPWC